MKGRAKYEKAYSEVIKFSEEEYYMQNSINDGICPAHAQFGEITCNYVSDITLGCGTFRAPGKFLYHCGKVTPASEERIVYEETTICYFVMVNG